MTISTKRQEDRDAVPAIVRDLLDKMLGNSPQHIKENYAQTVQRIVEVCNYDLDRFKFTRGQTMTRNAVGKKTK